MLNWFRRWVFRQWEIDRNMRKKAKQYQKESRPYPNLQAFMESRDAQKTLDMSKLRNRK